MRDTERIIKSIHDLLQNKPVCKCLKICLKIIELLKGSHSTVALMAHVYLLLKVILNYMKMYLKNVTWNKTGYRSYSLQILHHMLVVRSQTWMKSELLNYSAEQRLRYYFLKIHVF